MSLRPRCPRIGVARPRGSRARRGALAALAAVAASIALAACGAAAAQSTGANGTLGAATAGTGTTEFGAGGPAEPAVTAATLQGGRLSLAHFRGHVLVMNFWGSWCTECRAEAHTLALLSRQYGSSGVDFLGVDIRDNTASALAYMHDFGITYPSLSDPSGTVALAFRDSVPPSAIPTTLVISASGRIEARVLGTVSYAGLRNLISTALAGTS